MLIAEAAFVLLQPSFRLWHLHKWLKGNIDSTIHINSGRDIMNKLENISNSLRLIAILALGTVIASCGGGGSSSPPPPTVHGVAAAGAPIVGFAYLKDSASPAVTRGPVTIAADGSFSFDVTGLTAPFILKAEGSVGGQGVKLVSAATAAGTANINPLTNIAVAAATGITDPSSVYNNPLTYPITQVNLDAAIGEIQTMLQSLDTAYSATANPLTGSYSANHTGLDAVLDVVSVSLDTSTGGISVDSKVTGTTIGAASIGASGITVTNTISASEVPATSTITDLQAIGNALSSLATTINLRGVSLVALDLDPYFASDVNFGMDNGFNRANTMYTWASNLSTLTSSISGVTGLALVSIDTSATPNVYSVSGYIKLADGTSLPLDELASKFIYESGSWKIKGNGHIARSSVYPRVVKNTGYAGATLTVTDSTGIALDTDVSGNMVNSAVMTGPGLPASGVPFVLMNGHLCYNNGSYCDVTYDAMDDATIGAIPDNAVYTVVYKDISNATLETRQFTVAKRPYKKTELASGSFLGTNVTSHSLADAHYGGTFSFTYTLPTEYVATDISTEMAFNEVAGVGMGNQMKVHKQLSMSGSSASMMSVAAGWTPVEAYLYTRAVDQYGRQFHTYWQFK